MQVSLRHRPAYSLAYLVLDAGEQVFVERGSMAVMSGGVSVRAATGSGVSTAIARRAIGGESLVFSAFKGEITGAWLAVAPPRPGDIEVVELAGTGLLVQTGALLAYAEGVDVSLRYGGVRSVIMHEGVVFLHVAGEGDAVLCSYGAIERLDVGQGETLIVDTGHLVAFDDTMQFEVGPLGSISTAALTGEGIVAKFTGPGVVYIQTRAERDLRSWLLPTRGQNEQR
jgi:uncharacterized protein (TIGR00266 family)